MYLKIVIVFKIFKFVDLIFEDFMVFIYLNNINLKCIWFVNMVLCLFCIC